MQLDQKKKIIIMAVAVGLLLIGAVVVLFGFRTEKQPTDEELWGHSTPSSAPATSKPTPPPASLPPAASQPAPQSQPTPAPVAAATTPTAAPQVEQSAEPALVDPFAGGPGRPPKPKPKLTPAQIEAKKTYIPIQELPVIPVKPTEVKPEQKNSDDDFDFSSKPGGSPTNLGRNYGWIANNTKGQVTAYFDRGDGNVTPVVLGAQIDGRQVKSIDQDAIILVDQATGREERVKMLAGQRVHLGGGRAD